MTGDGTQQSGAWHAGQTPGPQAPAMATPAQGYQQQPAPVVVQAGNIPGAAMAAAILWIIYGALGLLGGLSILAAGGAAYFQLIFGLAFLVTGIQVMMGRASNILGSGITCIILGTLTLIGSMSLMSSLGRAGALIPAWVTTLVLLNSLLLIVAGILACVGNAPFRAWRVARGLAPPPAPGHAPQVGYPQQGGYAAQVGYPQQGGHAAQVGYPQQGGHAAQVGYPQQGGHAAQVGYPQQGGHVPQVGYPQQAGNTPPTGLAQAGPVAAQVALCPACQSQLRFVQEIGAWRCDRCAA